MNFITVITTTYNRAYCLDKLYLSLKNQRCKSFKWLVVDDGSTDDTKKLIDGYIEENFVDIKYVYHENIGMTASRNVGYELSDTELSVIIDSDDWLAENAIEKIQDAWSAIDDDNVAGMVSLNQRKEQSLSDIKKLPSVERLKFSELHDKYHYHCDTKLIYRTEVAKSFPYPTFENERSFPASYKFRMIDLHYHLSVLNEVICIVDFNENGQTFSRVKQYKNNPIGYAFYRNEMMRISGNRRFIFKQAIHYVSSVIFSKRLELFASASKKLYVFLALPFGIAFNIYLRCTKRKSLSF